MSLIVNIFLIILVFGVIVFFHEFGHFIVAKINHITVIEFSIGMGPAFFSVKKNGTKYSLRMLPLGGYCMMVGEDGEEDLADVNSFANKSILARMAVIAAGPVFNFILAFIFAIILVHNVGCDPIGLSVVQEGGAAYDAGIEVGDRVLEIEGKKVYNYRELLLFMATTDLSKPFTMKMATPEGKVYDVTLSARLNSEGEYKIGVAAGRVEADSFLTEIKYAALECRYCVKSTIESLRMIITGKAKGTQIMGPVGAGDVMNEVIEEVKKESDTRKEMVINVLLNLINWCILLSVNLGVMNLLPIPALDGGRLLFLVIEAVRRKKIPPEKENLVNLIGFMLLIGLTALIFFNDIKNIIFKIMTRK